MKTEQPTPEVPQAPLADAYMTDEEAEKFERQMVELMSAGEQAFPLVDDGEDAQKTGYSGFDIMPSGAASPVQDSEVPETLQVPSPPASPRQTVLAEASTETLAKRPNGQKPRSKLSQASVPKPQQRFQKP